MTHDDALLDAIAVFALGALPESEARPVALHIATCDACRREYAGLREAADAIGFAAELVPGDLQELAATRLKTRVMSAVRADRAAGSTRATNDPTSARNGAGRVQARAGTPWLAYGAALAAAVVAAISLADDTTQRAANSDRGAQVARLQHDLATQSALADATAARARELDARLSQIVAPGSKHFPIAGGEVIASGGRIFMVMRDLPALPEGKVYQAWTLARGAKAVAPSITFAPSAGGVALIELPQSAGDLAAVAVSVEPTGGSKAPTSKPNFVRALS